MKCFCNSGKEFKKCCGPLLNGKKSAKTPLELMRSRYSAYVTKNIDYLVETTLPENRKLYPKEDLLEWANSSKFFNLEIINSQTKENSGSVEFKAYYELIGKVHIHHEYSIFQKVDGKWYFEDGMVME